MIDWLDKYSGIPFKDFGRDFDGCDCYGLLYLIYKHELGIDLPKFDTGYQSTQDREALEKEINMGADSLFTPVPTGEPLKPFDVLIIRQVGFDCHIGIVLDHKRMIHTEKSTNVVLEEYSRPHVKPRIRGIFRYGK